MNKQIPSINTIQQAFLLGVQHHQAGRLVDAEAIYRQILTEEPMHAGSLLYLGVIAHQVGQNDAAVDLIRRSTAIAPGYAEAYNNLGVVLEAMGLLDEASAAYRHAIALKPEYADAQSNLRRILRDKGLTDEAMALHDEVRATRFAKLAPEPNFLSLHDDLPPELKGLPPTELANNWPRWVEHLDRQVRARVWRGEEDTLANYLLLGTGYTGEPRITDTYRAGLVQQFGCEQDADNHVKSKILARSHDLARALGAPDGDERLLTTLEIVNRAGYASRTPEGQVLLAQYLFENLVRFLNEARSFSSEMRPVNSKGLDTTSIANLYQSRGLSTDSSILVDCALHKGLRHIKNAGFLKSETVRRAGVIGAGLDFIDKLGGYDLHPPQITQPLLLTDTLLKLKLANENDLQIAILDISTRVFKHVERAVSEASDGQCYTLNLIHDSALEWSVEAVHFWETCGDQIVDPSTCQQSSNFNGVFNRSIQVRPEWVTGIDPIDINIVCEQLPASEDESFDLLVATNVLCYYDPFQQSLALRNAERILRPGGILLTTEELVGARYTNMSLLCDTHVKTSNQSGYTIFCYGRSI